LLTGVVDFYPAVSGKEGAARHLMARWGVGPAATAFLCDDDNDLALAAVVGKAFLPSTSAVSGCMGRGKGGGGRGSGGWWWWGG
jgi:3-deoxy-D-manno-octulosonate 8-phosphate phosphatase KdsC-like HAD superfamily phosphatase